MKWLVSQAPYPSGVYTKLGKVGPVQDLAFKGEEHMIEFETCVQKLIGKGATVPAKLQGVIGRCDKDIIAYVHSLHKKIDSFSELLTFNFDLALHVIDSKAKNPFRVEPVAKSKKNAATTGIGF
jgi:hypothetical protein